METYDGQGSILPRTESESVPQQAIPATDLFPPSASQCTPPVSPITSQHTPPVSPITSQHTPPMPPSASQYTPPTQPIASQNPFPAPQYPPPVPQRSFAPPQYSHIPPQFFPAPPSAIHPEENPLPKATIMELILAIVLLVLGFCFWDWGLLIGAGSGFGTTVFFLTAIAISFTYLQSKGIQQNRSSLLMLLVAVAGSLPFALNGYRDINALLLLFETAACLLWVMYSCRTTISDTLSGLMLGDLINQAFVVSFGNFSRYFTQPFKLLQKGRKAWRSVLLAAIGFIICIPVFILVATLLSWADDGFREFTVDFFDLLERIDAFDLILKLVFGIPIAAYIFGAVFGNLAKRHTSHLSGEGFLHTFEKAHILPRAVLYLPLGLFVALYVVFFITMGSYLFSGLQGQLPVEYTFAEYARRGFFELCTVAVINLFILSAIWLLAKRNPREYPLPLRILSALLALLTCLLVVTAMSKMLLYIQTYSLTPLRLYTSCFMVLLLLVFSLLVAWHIRPFNAARPIIALVFVFALGLGLANTNGFIANYNVDRYLSGQTGKIDVSLLIDLGDAAMPALVKLEQNAADKTVRDEAADVIESLRKIYERDLFVNDFGLTTWGAWHSQSLQSLKADWLYAKR